jgi:hypothetical protein
MGLLRIDVLRRDPAPWLLCSRVLRRGSGELHPSVRSSCRCRPWCSKGEDASWSVGRMDLRGASCALDGSFALCNRAVLLARVVQAVS